MITLLKEAVTNVHFTCNWIWYEQSDGLGIGPSLAVVLANVWMKSFEAWLQKQQIREKISYSDQNAKCKPATGEWLSEEKE